MNAKESRQYLYRILRGAGFERSHKSTSGSCYYELITTNADRIRFRISNHHLPQTDEREYNQSQGWSCADYEIIIYDSLPYSKNELDEMLAITELDLTPVKKIAIAPLRKRLLGLISQLEIGYMYQGDSWAYPLTDSSFNIKRYDADQLLDLIEKVTFTIEWEKANPGKMAEIVDIMLSEQRAYIAEANAKHAAKILNRKDDRMP